MAIQNRRGVYGDFDPAKMVPGEFAVVQNGDPEVEDGQSVYIAFNAGNVKRVLLDGESIPTDQTLTIAGKAADAGAVGEALTNMDAGLSDEAKEALLACFRNVAWINDQGEVYYEALEKALTGVQAVLLSTYSLMSETIGSTAQLTATTVPAGGEITWKSSNAAVATVSENGLVTFTGYGSATITASSGKKRAKCSALVSQKTVSSISATYTQSGIVYEDDTLDSLKPDLVVNATWSDSTQTTVPAAEYVLSGELTVGTSTITASYGGKTATFNVTVTASAAELTSISTVFDQGQNPIYVYDTLDDLRQYLTVTANYDDGTSEIVTDYTLSGTLSSATSIITAEYMGETATFNVTVTIDSSLIYYAPKGHILDGTNNTAIDTEVKLADTDKTFTILFDVTDEEILTRVRSGVVLVYGVETVDGNASGPNVFFNGAQSGSTYNKQYCAAYGAAVSLKSDSKTNEIHRLKGALSHTSRSQSYVFTLYVDGVVEFEMESHESAYVANSINTFIGRRNTGGYNWNGTINLLNIYNRALGLSEIKSLLGVS